MKKNQRINFGRSFHSLASIFCACGLVLVTVLYNVQLHVTAQLSDVAANSYEGQAALYLQKRGIVSGFPDGTFRGQNAVNRVEAAKMLLLAGNYTLRQIENTGSFADIVPSSWYEQFALNAVEKGIMSGYPDGTFGPARTIIRAEFLKMLSNTFALDKNLPFHYSDVPVDDWYSEYAGAAEKYNLFLYDKSQLLPSAPMSRDEIAWAMYQVLIFKANNLVIRTPFDFAFTTNPKVPTALHAAASSSAPSSVTTISSTPLIISSATSSATAARYCTDSDASNTFPDGLDVDKRGTAINLLMPQGENTFTDQCRAGTNVLSEFYCNADGYLALKEINCPINCVEGACSIQPIESSSQQSSSTISSRNSSSLSVASSNSSSSQQVFTGCNDTDATARFTMGNNRYAKGTTNGLLANGSRLATTDICTSTVNLKEYYCQANDLLAFEETACELGCDNGACVSPGTVGTCADEDATAQYPDGKNFTVRSRIYVNHPEEGNVSYEDTCIDNQVLEEFYCATNGRVGRYTQMCNCVEGKCV